MPVSPPPNGAIQSLWDAAANLQALTSYAAAVKVYEQLAALTPQDAPPLLAMGDIYLAQRRWPLAEDAFNRALARDGGNERALAGLAAARWEQGDRTQALRLWEQALTQPPVGREEPAHSYDRTDLRLHLALAYLDMGRLDDAQTMLAQALAPGDNPTARLYLAMMVMTEDTGRARRELAAIPGGGPAAVVAMRDYLLAALDQAEAAGSPPAAARALGLALIQIEEWQLARTLLERALALDPADPEALAYLGHTEAQLGRPAFAHLASAVAAQPDWPLGHYLLGLYYLKQRAFDYAAEELRVTLRLDPGNAQAEVDLARAYLSQGQYLAAEEALVRAVEAAPGDLTFHLALARFYADHGFRVSDRGLAAAQAAADLAPDDPQARDLLGWMYFLAGDAARARLHLESALRLDVGLASTYYHLGILRQRLGETEAARFAFLRAVDLDRDGFYRDQAHAALRQMDEAR